MAIYKWDPEKNELLISNRSISFEQIVLHVEQGDVLDIIEHPNQEKYPNQKVLVVKVNDYAYAVPFVEDGEERFLKTAVPSRKLTRKHLRKDHEKTTS